MKQSLCSLSCMIMVILISQCRPKVSPVSAAFGKGIYVANEGPFMGGSGSITYVGIDDQVIDTIIPMAFSEVNLRPVGNLLNDIKDYNDNIYMVLNGSASIEVVDDQYFQTKASITGFNQPRFFLPIASHTAVVSDWGQNQLYVVDLESWAIVDSVAAGAGPERMLLANGMVYVANSGAYGLDSTVSVYDVIAFGDQAGLSHVTDVTVGYGPNSLVQDVNGDVWCLAAGYADYTGQNMDVAGQLVRINANLAVDLAVIAPSAFDHPAKLQISPDGSTLYFLASAYGGSLLSMDVQATSYPSSVWISGAFYGLSVNPINGNLVLLDAVDFQSNGKLFRYHANTNLIDSVTVGVIPGNALMLF